MASSNKNWENCYIERAVSVCEDSLFIFKLHRIKEEQDINIGLHLVELKMHKHQKLYFIEH